MEPIDRRILCTCCFAYVRVCGFVHVFFHEALTFVLEYFSFIVGISYSYIQIECQLNVYYSGLTKIQQMTESESETTERKEQGKKEKAPSCGEFLGRLYNFIDGLSVAQISTISSYFAVVRAIRT